MKTGRNIGAKCRRDGWEIIGHGRDCPQRDGSVGRTASQARGDRNVLFQDNAECLCRRNGSNRSRHQVPGFVQVLQCRRKAAGQLECRGVCRSEPQAVGQGRAHMQAVQTVIAVVQTPGHVEPQVDLGMGRDRPFSGRCHRVPPRACGARRREGPHRPAPVSARDATGIEPRSVARSSSRHHPGGR